MMQLVCLFILLYSVSSLDKGRMARVAAAYRASVGIGEAAAYDGPSAGDKLAVGDRSLIGGALGWLAGVGVKRGVDGCEIAKSDLIVVWGGNPVSTQINMMTHVAAAPVAGV